MKKYVLSALLGAILMFLTLVLFANRHNAKQTKEYEHVDFISAISPEECFVCSGQGSHWGEDNVGIVNLNTLELLYLPINRYDDYGNLIKAPAGVMQKSSLINLEAGIFVQANIFPDQACASVNLSGVEFSIDRDSIQTHLCQECLNSINSMCFAEKPPAEFAVISFGKRTVQPLLNAYTWFPAGNYGVDCEFKDGGEIDLLIHYAVNPYLINP